MPVREVVDTVEPSNAADQIFAAFEPYARTMRAAHIARAGRGKAKPVLRQLECQLAPDEEPGALVRFVAERLVEIALEDAGDKKHRYTATAFGAAADGHKAPVLTTVIVTLGGDDDDDDRDRESPSAIRAATALADSVGDRQLRLLDTSVGLFEKLAPMVAARDAANAMNGQAAVEIRKLEIADAREREAAFYADQASDRMWGTVNELSNRHKNLLDAIADMLVAKAHEMRGRKGGGGA